MADGQLTEQPSLLDALEPPTPEPKRRGAAVAHTRPLHVDAVDTADPTSVGACWCDNHTHPGDDWFTAMRRPNPETTP